MRFLLGVVAVLLVLVVGGLIWLYSGAYSVAAADSHHPAMAWLVEKAQLQSVRAHARAVEVPVLGDPILIEEGARRFSEHCVMCHGAPGAEAQPWARTLWPQPPDLGRQTAHWSSADLFWIIRNGLALTAMPAWGRVFVDAEIWALVAFINQLSTMDAARYQALTAPPPAPMPPGQAQDEVVPPAEEAEPPREGAAEPAPAQ